MNKEYEVSSKGSNHLKNIQEKAILIGTDFHANKNSSIETSLKELSGLAETAHYYVISTLSQKIATINAKTFIGKEKSKKLLN